MTVRGRYDRNNMRLILRSLRRTGEDFKNTMVTERLSGPTGANSLSVRTGALRRAVKSKVSTRPPASAALFVFVDSTAPYAAIHETGGTVRPKRSKFLAIPVGKALTKAGVTKGAFRRPREIHNLFFTKTKKGNFVLAVARKGGGIEVLFALKRIVKIPPRLGFAKTFKSESRKGLTKLRKELKRVGVKLRLS